MRDLAVRLVHVLATVARLAGPGGVRAVVAESLLVKQQLLILNRSRRRSPRLRLSDRVIAGVLCAADAPARLVVYVPGFAFLVLVIPAWRSFGCCTSSVLFSGWVNRQQ